jgi:hypothetical protein
LFFSGIVFFPECEILSYRILERGKKIFARKKILCEWSHQNSDQIKVAFVDDKNRGEIKVG